MRRTFLVVLVAVTAVTSGCSLLDSSQEMSVTGTVMTEDLPENERIVPYESLEDEPARDAARLAVADHEPDEPGYDAVLVSEREVEPDFEDGIGYVEYEGYVVRVAYETLD